MAYSNLRLTPFTILFDEFYEMKRRAFLASTAASATAWALTSQPAYSLAQADAKTPDHPIAIFTKVFQQHSFDQLGELLNEVGANGAEATLRKGGHIEPNSENFAEQVQQLVRTLEKHQQKVLIAASDINELTPDTERQLKVFRDHGITHYRLRYWTYTKGTSPVSQLAQFSRQAQKLAEFNKQHGLVGLCQNHAGANICGNLVWDLAMVLKDVDPKHLGIALDLRHLRAEIRGAYQNAIESVRDRLVSVFVKDTAQASSDPRKDQLKEVPLGTGLVHQELFRNVIRSVPAGPISLHVEYHGQKPIAPENCDAVTAAYRQDLLTLRSWLAE